MKNKILKSTIAAIIVVAIIFSIGNFALSAYAGAISPEVEQESLVQDESTTIPAQYESVPVPSIEKTVSVTGMATTSVEPDLLRIQFGVETQEKTAREALETNSELMASVISAIKQAGVSEDELNTSLLNVYPVYDSYHEKETGRYTQELIGYRVSNILNVETPHLELAASVIDSAVSAGVNKVDGVFFTLSPSLQQQIKDSLLEQAVLNAHSKAQTALSPLSHTIIGVKSINLSEFSLPPPMPFARAYDVAVEAMSLSDGTQVFSANQDVTATASVVFLIGDN